jgi:ribonuclease-3
MKPNHFHKLEAQIGISFQNPDLLREAFTHASYVNERKTEKLKDNERLEFLGDAVLGILVGEYVFAKLPNSPEGQLSKSRASIVCEASLAQFAEELAFGDYMLLGRGEEATGGRMRPSLLADVFEAFLGALYLDQGLDVVKLFLHKHVFPQVRVGSNIRDTDFKSRLQEHVQQLGLGTPEYAIVEQHGPSHDRAFVSEVRLNGSVIGQGVGRSKKEAEQSAAKFAYEVYKK